MKRWCFEVFNAGTTGDADLFKSMDAADAYLVEHDEAKRELFFEGRIETLAMRLPGLMEYRFSQLQDIEAILEYLETRQKKAMADKTRYYLEHYQRTLSDRVAREYAEASDEVQLILSVKHRVVVVRNLFLGITKGLETMHFQTSNVTKLKCAGFEDAEVSFRRH